MRQSDLIEKLSVCLKKLHPFKAQKKDEILQDPYLRDIIESLLGYRKGSSNYLQITASDEILTIILNEVKWPLKNLKRDVP